MATSFTVRLGTAGFQAPRIDELDANSNVRFSHAKYYTSETGYLHEPDAALREVLTGAVADLGITATDTSSTQSLTST